MLKAKTKNVLPLNQSEVDALLGFFTLLKKWDMQARVCCTENEIATSVDQSHNSGARENA